MLDLVEAPEALRHQRAEPVIDTRARDAYRNRVTELRAELVQAESWHDFARAARLREELEQVAAELARTVGLGGRVRNTSDAAERARVNVQRRIATTLSRVREHSPTLADHLQATLRTGLFCSYEPQRAVEKR